MPTLSRPGHCRGPRSHFIRLRSHRGRRYEACRFWERFIIGRFLSQVNAGCSKNPQWVTKSAGELCYAGLKSQQSCGIASTVCESLTWHDRCSSFVVDFATCSPDGCEAGPRWAMRVAPWPLPVTPPTEGRRGARIQTLTGYMRPCLTTVHPASRMTER